MYIKRTPHETPVLGEDEAFEAVLEPGDALPCPFCGGNTLSLRSLAIASYRLTCSCGALMVGGHASTLPEFAGSANRALDSDAAAHRAAAEAAIVKWNARASAGKRGADESVERLLVENDRLRSEAGCMYQYIGEEGDMDDFEAWKENHPVWKPNTDVKH